MYLNQWTDFLQIKQFSSFSEEYKTIQVWILKFNWLGFSIMKY